jgi:hypothetical protein
MERSCDLKIKKYPNQIIFMKRKRKIVTKILRAVKLK